MTWETLCAHFRRSVPPGEAFLHDLQRYQARQADLQRNLAWLEQQVALLTRDVARLAPPPPVGEVPPRAPRQAGPR